ncbi:ABC transporter permease [Raineyella fluvialis]|uniref:Autoinducer 2 import system permease protein LsrC n=1 Tax=Raineyella fluvialis TaxID=2662261 RepID=A0A5Q2F895_9ACTN|nr:ABC transporter permease [Raineyella fluvialis]QGF22878.1 ABC transporter permease [Raineyella fluvialis]
MSETYAPAPGLFERLGFTGGAAALRIRYLGVIGFQLILMVAFTSLVPRFIGWPNLQSVLFTAAIMAIAVCGQTIVVLTGNLDLSVGSVMGLTAYVVFDIAGHHRGLGPYVVLMALVIGALLGLLNGTLVAVLEIPSIVATLGTLSIYRGFVSFYAHATEVTVGQLPPWTRAVASSRLLGVSSYVWIALVVVILIGLALRWLPGGRTVYAYGSNPKAARSYGLRSTRIVIGAYIASGTIASLAGLMLGAQVGNINSLVGDGFELQVLAAAVIGGVSIWGGSGSVYGAAMGCIVLATINNGLVLLGVQEFYRQLIQGAAIVTAVAIDALVQQQVAARLSRRSVERAAA